MPVSAPSESRDRLDKWLWHARFFKTRSLAAEAARTGKVRVNGVRADKASAYVRLDDVLTIARSGRILVVRVTGFSARRGGAADAAALYDVIEGPAASSSR